MLFYICKKINEEVVHLQGDVCKIIAKRISICYNKKGGLTMANKNLQKAKSAKNDEFYTQYVDIEKEMNAYLYYNKDVFRGKTVLCPCDDPEWSNFTKYFAQSFDRLGLKKLISTSFAYNSKEPKPEFDWQPTLFETENAKYNAEKSIKNGKIFTLTDKDEPPRNIEKLDWNYLEGDGDFRSDEVRALRDEADVIVTNPPFSLFREFIAWIFEAKKEFAVIGNKNAITYKEIFPLIMQNKMWVGKTPMSQDILFNVPNQSQFTEEKKVGSGFKVVNGIVYARAPAVWFTNIEHGRRHQPISLMDTIDNIRYSNHKEIRENGYQKYDNYDAIEVPFTETIPKDYDGVMGVPISFMDKYCPEQFEIVGLANHGKDNEYDLFAPKLNGRTVFKRILIRVKQ